MIFKTFIFKGKIFKYSEKYFWGVTTPTPLKKNLIPEISAVLQTGTDIQSSSDPLFPMLLLPRCDYSPEPCKILSHSAGFSVQILPEFL